MRGDFLYGMQQVARVLDCALKSIIRVQEWWKVLRITIKGQRPTFVSKRKFFTAFIAARKAAAKGATVVPLGIEGMPHAFNVISEGGSGVRHYVKPTNTALVCDCEDYSRQIQRFGKACCKHGYAILGRLGFDSLSEYVLHRQAF